MKRIKIIEPQPLLFPDICDKIVKAFSKKKIKITPTEAQHLWHLLAVDNGLGWVVKKDRTDAEIVEECKKYYILDES